MNFDFLLESIKPTQTSTITIDATGALVFPAGNTATRPSGVPAGSMRWNTETSGMEIYNGSAWVGTVTKAGDTGNGHTIIVNVSSSSMNLDMTTSPASYQLNMTNTAITNLTVGSTPTSVFSLVLFIQQLGPGGVGITWPSTIRFGGNAPNLSTTPTGKYDIIYLLTNDFGATWFGFVAGRNM